MMAAAFLVFLGWEQLTAAEQAAAVGGACLGLAAWLVARAVFGGRTQRLGDPVSDTKHERQSIEKNVRVEERVNA